MVRKYFLNVTVKLLPVSVNNMYAQLRKGLEAEVYSAKI